MSCACENKKLSTDRERIARLAKALAVTEGEDTAVYLNEDGTYGFATVSHANGKNIVEYKTPY